MTDVRLTPAHRRALDLQKEGLVRAAEILLSEGEVTAIPKNKLGDSQLNNLLAIANETESPAVVTNFIRYQMGRDGQGRHWSRPGASGRKLGDLFIDAIETGAVHQAVEAVGLTGVERQLAHIYLTRHFLGFVSRHLKYLEPQRAQGREDAA